MWGNKDVVSYGPSFLVRQSPATKRTLIMVYIMQLLYNTYILSSLINIDSWCECMLYAMLAGVLKQLLMHRFQLPQNGRDSP